MENILNKAKAWINEESIDQSDRDEIKQLIDSDSMEELTERFYKDLEFGTGGLEQFLATVAIE